MHSDALNKNADDKADKQIKSDHQKPPDDGTTTVQSIDDIDQSQAIIAGNEITSSSDGGFNAKASIDDRRNSFAHQNGSPSNSGNSLISRDALILLPEGGKNSASNGDKYPVTRSSRNSDNENSDTDVSKVIIKQSVEYYDLDFNNVK